MATRILASWYFESGLAELPKDQLQYPLRPLNHLNRRASSQETLTVHRKNTATRQSLAFLAEILIWVITSSRRAFSLQAYCVIASVWRLTNKTRQLPKRDPRRPCARLPTPLDTLIPAALFVIGQTFIVTSTWSLSITTTFLGDYFGILMDARVEGFPSMCFVFRYRYMLEV
ncbi:hypothetical protein BGY98DRAFT_1155226 [Russula aff. rugulosa BPL654]|nr:hypothetical protein BGY98DRAFT_1155226 [Russula aff. rugulosa BPL654]